MNEGDRFEDCLLVIRKKDDKIYTVLNNCRSIEEVIMSMGLSEESLQNRRDQIRMIQHQEKQRSGIVVPGFSNNPAGMRR